MPAPTQGQSAYPLKQPNGWVIKLFSPAGAPWEYLHKPLVGLTKATSDRCMEMCVATARVMGEFPEEDDLGKLEESIHALIDAR